eukprot:TRINITY_DN46589_c0_g1_i1.p1 TRINITY_DN46589_c0_g1~~TRINITY_DN46589_c0_g1_i1.p1  ORF type:complete len:433 (+),score=78.32 TRINITY_DN46589_c0_g1_i1:79-1377(+)
MAARSRSPRDRNGVDAEWISRSIATFGRYPERRPRGFSVDTYGSFYLEDLMDCWGDQYGVTEKDVLQAIQLSMFNEDKGGKPTLRFGLEYDDEDRIIIRVLPRGAIASSSSTSHGEADRAGGPGVHKKLDMALDEVIRGGEPGIRYRRSENGSSAEQRARVLHKIDQMGLTVGSQHTRLTPHGGRPNGGERNAHRSLGEQVGRWISWVLAKGHQKLGVAVDQGWADLGILAAAMSLDKPLFGKFDGEKLRAFMLEIDTDKRFEISGNRLRKRSQEERSAMQTHRAVPHPPSGAAHQVPPGAAAAAARDPLEATSAALAASTLAKSETQDEAADAALADACGRLLRVSGDVTLLDANSADALSASNATASTTASGATSMLDDLPMSTDGAPPKPPGDGWTKFKDEDTFWWYYEGPHGKWWCSEHEEVPKPYED